jgi:DNA-binding CsgD family transcriptional regulator
MELTPVEREWLAGPLADLTPREREVALAVCEGGDHEHVAASLCIAVPTLRTHLMRIHQKLGAESKADVVRFVSARLLELYRTHGSAGGAAGFGGSSGRSAGSFSDVPGGERRGRSGAGASKPAMKRDLGQPTPA